MHILTSCFWQIFSLCWKSTEVLDFPLLPWIWHASLGWIVVWSWKYLFSFFIDISLDNFQVGSGKNYTSTRVQQLIMIREYFQRVYTNIFLFSSSNWQVRVIQSQIDSLNLDKETSLKVGVKNDNNICPQHIPLMPPLSIFYPMQDLSVCLPLFCIPICLIYLGNVFFVFPISLNDWFERFFIKKEETQANWENPGFTSFMFLIVVNNLEIDNQKCRNLPCSIVIYLMLKLTDA